jgi:hypothetical protein
VNEKKKAELRENSELVENTDIEEVIKDLK